MKTVLKIYKLLTVLLLMISFSACSSDDSNEKEPTVSELLENKWFLLETTDTSTDPETIEVANSCSVNSYYNFLNDGTLLVQLYNLDADENCVSSSLEVFNYILSADGTKIIVEFENGDITNIIIDSIDNEFLELYNEETPDYRVLFSK
ncbi:hypothetical protein PW52_03010 [Tamlana sedimentorum]|uniref:Lipocalin-like domain-containing protein n=1 Tax=Neotamlana sedimentorum TaxID=1435349 RepID=A0A0D7WBX9_9FLAO|nr:hypothetical protein [Tamlana sedimentorum]KJD36631.1 hypothetical protein PW52_03010 [Tamlana sedimentorum]